MKILFSHRNFPAQFRHLLFELSKNSENEIIFLTNRKDAPDVKGVHKIVYNLKREVPKNSHRYVGVYEEAIIHGQAVAEIAIQLKHKGFTPDVIYGHPWGNTMFLKDIYPDVPFLCYFEWFYNSEGSDMGFDGKTLTYDTRAKTRCKNSQMLIDLYSCDKGISPTMWQKKQFPKEFHSKIEVLHDGVDTDYFVPNLDAVLKIPNSDIELSTKDEIVTYATRGMEPYRGFPQFMKMAEKLLKRRQNVHIVIGGDDRVCYGKKAPNGSYKELMLKKLDLDMSRVHFTGSLPYGEYKKLLQISSAHVYLTYPFVLSWSLIEAMSCGCCIVSSKTAPVEEVIKDGQNGLLVDFYDIETMTNSVEYVLDNQDKIQQLRHNARQTAVDNYALKDLLPKHIQLLNDLISKKALVSSNTL